LSPEGRSLNRKQEFEMFLYQYQREQYYNKMSEFREKVNTGNYDIIGITETWANEYINDAELNTDGYNMYRKDRSKIRGGGLILYINSLLRAGVNEELTKCEFEESLWCNNELDRQRFTADNNEKLLYDG